MLSRIDVRAVALTACLGTAFLAASASGADQRRPVQPKAGADYASPYDTPATPPGDAFQDGPPPSSGPQGSSQPRPGEDRFDRVGYAGVADGGPGIYAFSDTLPVGTHVEVTALDSGRTIVLAIRGQGRGLIDLSSDAAQQLGVTGTPAVRVRRVRVAASEAALLAEGRAGTPRADAPPALLAGLRRQLGARAASKASPAKIRPASPAPRPSPPPTKRPEPVAAAQGGLFVQVAALSNEARAQALARQLGGVVRAGGAVYRVQTGPHANAAAAERARADIARRGYGDARIVKIP